MQVNRSHDTGPELRLRSELHRRGLRFRNNLPVRVGDLCTRPDIVFTRRRIAVFVDGCFWHRCPEHASDPKVNSAYWQPKLERNVGRDRLVDDALRAYGWTVVRVWEHECPVEAAERVEAAVAAGAA
jgi:DNA mismatch endonuclease (patch repair protein)